MESHLTFTPPSDNLLAQINPSAMGWPSLTMALNFIPFWAAYVCGKERMSLDEKIMTWRRRAITTRLHPWVKTVIPSWINDHPVLAILRRFSSEIWAKISPLESTSLLQDSKSCSFKITNHLQKKKEKLTPYSENALVTYLMNNSHPEVTEIVVLPFKHEVWTVDKTSVALCSSSSTPIQVLEEEARITDTNT